VEIGELAPGLWWWTSHHPEWEPAQSWPSEVRCFCIDTDDGTLVVDPLVAEDEEDLVWAALDRAVERRRRPVFVLLTQAAHARSASAVAARYDADVWGPEQARAKVAPAAFHELDSGDAVPGGHVLELEQEPGGSGAPLYFAGHEAIAVGDVFISRDDGLHVWWGHGASDESWYDERLLPSLRRWLELPLRHLLVAHGPLVAEAELRAALDRPPDRGE
jgi:hypothetical protein